MRISFRSLSLLMLLTGCAGGTTMGALKMTTKTSLHFLEVKDGQLAYEDQGEGPLVVCVPGIGDVRGQYRYLAPALVEAGHRVVTMDLRGLGDSSAGFPG